MTARSRLVLPALAACLAFASMTAAQPAAAPPAVPAAARQAAPAARPQAPVRAVPESSQRTRIVTESQDARETQQQLRETLRRYSPSLGGVFKLDPSLLTNPEYLAPYPELGDLLARHPEIARDPGYFFEDVELPSRREPVDARSQVISMWRNTVEASMFFVVFLVVTATLLWLIKTLIDYRRWSRLSKVQADVHNKVLDRFGNNEELLAYVQTPAGRRFLESAPITLDAAGPAVAAPLRRILWSVEAGCVLMAGGIGIQFVSGRSPEEVAPMLFGVGVLGLAIGIGFVVAAGVSFLISRRMGLLDGPSAPGPVA